MSLSLSAVNPELENLLDEFAARLQAGEAADAEAFAKLVKTEPSIDVNLDQLKNGLEYNLGTTANRQQWSNIFTEVKAG